MKTVESILSEIQNIDHEKAVNKEFYTEPTIENENEFLLILKPELFVHTNTEAQKKILELIFAQLKRYNFQVNNARIITAKYLKKYEVMDLHYGVINAAARSLKEAITEEGLANFKLFYGLDFSNAKAIGALELLESGIMDSTTLSELWKRVEIKRLAGGIYSGKVNYKGEELYIVNGFHPPQLEHFIADKRLIITLNVSSNTPWKVARGEMTGNTYPEKADKNSIRGALFQNFQHFGFGEVSYVLNSVHLSAGPLEGLLEMQRFNSEFKNQQKAKLSTFRFGKMLAEQFSPKEIEKITSNPIVQYEGKSISLFDLTEEMNSADALDLINIQSFKNRG